MFNAKGETYFGETPDVNDERNNLLYFYILFVGGQIVGQEFWRSAVHRRWPGQRLSSFNRYIINTIS